MKVLQMSPYSSSPTWTFLKDNGDREIRQMTFPFVDVTGLEAKLMSRRAQFLPTGFLLTEVSQSENNKVVLLFASLHNLVSVNTYRNKYKDLHMT